VQVIADDPQLAPDDLGVERFTVLVVEPERKKPVS
jgi:hypothetical protein